MMDLSVVGLAAVQIGAVALLAALSVTGFLRLAGLEDRPNHRSSHTEITPTAGGVGVIAGVGAALAYAGIFYGDSLLGAPGAGPRFATLTAILFAIGMLGLLDDRFVLSERLKLVVMILISVVTALVAGVVTELPINGGRLILPWGLGLLGTAVWLFVTINTVNFMDGIDGMMGLSMAVASGALCALALRAGAPQTALISGSLCAALLGFMVYNAPPKARIFAGDSGALFVGLAYGASVLLLVRERPDLPLLYAGPLLILPLLTDVLLTLLSKPFRNIPMLAAHRAHLFQRLSRFLGSHGLTTLLYATLCALMAQWVTFAFLNDALGSPFLLMLMVGVFTALYIIATVLLPDDI